MSGWSSSRTKKVTWDPDHARLKVASERLFSDSEVDDMVQDSERSLRSIRKSSETLRRELEILARKREALRNSHEKSEEKPREKVKTAVRDTVEENSSEEERDEDVIESKQSSVHQTDFHTKRSAALTIEDYITSEDVLDFLHHYFPGKTNIETEEFVSCLELDFPDIVQIPGFRDALVSRITVETDFVSLNRLQTLTQEVGLEAAIAEIADGLEAEMDAEEKQVNATIVEEMAELNELLANKTKELAQREAELDSLTKDHQIMRNRVTDMAQTEIERMAEESLQLIKNQASFHIKKMQRLEKSLIDNMRILRTKMQAADKAKPDPEKYQAEAARQKARIQALEKMNDHLKGKNSALEVELNTVKTQNQKLSEETGRIKAKNSHLEQLVVDLKNQKTKEITPAKPTDSEPQPFAAVPVPADVDKSPNAETVLSLSIFGILVSGLRDILPLFLTSPLRGSEDISPVSSLRSSLATEENWMGFGQLLYPTFNALVPKLIELLPVITKLKGSPAVEQTIALLHGLITYTYTEHLQDDSSLVYPERIEFLPSTEFWRKKLSIKGKASDRGAPLYPLFSNLKVHKSAVAQLSKLTSNASPLCALQSSVLMLILSPAVKRHEQALRCLKSLISEQKWCEAFLSDPGRSLAVVIEAIRAGKEGVAALGCQVVLLASMNPKFGRYVENVGRGTFQVKVRQSLVETTKNVLSAAGDSEKTDLEEYLMVILQKLACSRLVVIRRRDPIADLLSRRITALQRVASTPDVKFVLENMTWVLQHAE